MDFKTIKAELSKPFAPEDLEWRLQGTNKAKTGGFAVPYVTNRAIMDRLDDVVGPENWRNEFRPWHGNGKKDAQICGISIYSEEHQEWIIKYDGAEDTDIEAVKGGLSDSMKRAAVHWGIGRVLYKMDTVWVDIEQRGNSYATKHIWICSKNCGWNPRSRADCNRSSHPAGNTASPAAPRLHRTEDSRCRSSRTHRPGSRLRLRKRSSRIRSGSLRVAWAATS